MRKLTIRERVLLACLVLLATVSGYVLLFHMPITQRANTIQMQIAQEEELAAQLDARLSQQRHMKQVLKQFSEEPEGPVWMPEYDNLQAVMAELNAIMRDCQAYSITFQEEQGEDNILRRRATIPFTCANYQQVKETLQKLHDSPLRNFLSDLQFAKQENGTIKASVKMVFFEYRESTAD